MRSAVAVFVLALAIVPQAEGRDRNTTAGMQYAAQGWSENRMTLEDRQGYFEKAGNSLNKGLANDPKDGMAWIYLSSAYAELDSFEQSGRLFAEAIRRSSDDPKLLKRATDHRDSYFNTAYNEGFAACKEATTILPAEEIGAATNEKGRRAMAKFAVAEARFRGALLMNAEKAIAYNQLATMLALQGRLDEASLVVGQGLARSMPKAGEEYERLLRHKAR